MNTYLKIYLRALGFREGLIKIKMAYINRNADFMQAYPQMKHIAPQQI